jgi:DNA-directed DNA polymerase III PolC
MSDHDFVHLHVHTEFSLLDGLSKIKKLVAHAKSLDMRALAITDHGTMFGVIDFYRACKAADIKPILGVEGYQARRTMQDRDSKLDAKPYHLLMLAQNINGYKNLLKIASAAQLEGYYYKPRIDRQFLIDHADGIITTSGCLAAHIPSLVLGGQFDTARNLVHENVDIFGRDNFYLELQQHKIDELKPVNEWLIETAQRDNLQLVATNDVHYVLADDYDAHDTLLCIQTSALKHEDNRMKMTDNSYFLSDQALMWQHFGHIQDGAPLLNSLKIAEMCELNLDDKEYHLPVFPVPKGYDSASYLRYLADKGLHWRFPERADDAALRQRLEHELNVINNMGFPTYFLIVWDLCQFALAADIWWNVRGSGAGSLVAYCLGITNIDPILNNLLFERFLNPGRVSMPDIDIDFPDDRRSEMIAYCSRKYGEDKVAAIITFGTMGAKAAVRDVGRALNVPLDVVNQAARLIPTEPKPKPIMEYVEGNPDLKRLYEGNPDIRRIIQTAENLQGVTRHASTHAAGIIVADKPLVEYVPLHRLTNESKGSSEDDNPIKQVTQFPMETAESIGLLKIDFLGLSTLSQLRLTCELIERYHGIHYDMGNIPYRPSGDAKQDKMLAQAFEMISRGETIGVFQIESTGMQEMLRGMRPTKFEHIIAAVSLYRPGPMDYIPEFNARMHGTKEINYHHEKLRSILEETYGIMTYQEQIMQIASELFGYSLGEADLMRRAVSKKKKEDLLKHKEIFIKNGPEHGVSAEAAEKIFDDIEFFANYGFNKCVTGDTQIVDADSGRVVRVDDLYAGRERVHHTLSLDTETLRLIHSPITHVHQNGVKPVYRLTTQLGRQITATDNHPFYTFDGWRNLGELRTDGTIAVSREAASNGSVDIEALRQRQDSHIYWDRIVSIEYVGEEMTYDLTIDGTHNFVANDIIVHNSHAADYAVITVQSAFTKCHYPEEYMAALLTIYFDDSDKVTTFLAECKRLSIPILQPDVNASELNFTIQKQADGRRGIRFGLAAVKNAGVGALTLIINAREQGEFRDLQDLCERVDLRQVGKRTIESLIKVGALGAFGGRAELLSALDRIISYSADHHKAKEIGQMSMFGGVEGIAQEDILGKLPEGDEVSAREMLNWEKELLGFYVSSHPIDPVLHIIQGSNFDTTKDLKEAPPERAERPVKIIGLVAGLRKLPTKNKDMMAVVQLEDHFSRMDVVFFPRPWARVEAQVYEGAVLQFTGKLDLSRGDAQIIGEGVTDQFQATTSDGMIASHYRSDEKLSWMDADESAFAPPPPDWNSSEDDDAFFSPPEAITQAVTTPPKDGKGDAAREPAVKAAPPPQPIDPDALVWLTNGDESIEPAPPEPLPDEVVSRRLLRVQFPRSGDSDKDARRFGNLIKLITSYPGEDRFMVQVDGDWYTFDDHKTGICDALLRELHKRVGADNIAIEG